jgi:hypothetical protein
MKKKTDVMNAVVLNGKVTELTEEQVKSIVDGLAMSVNTAGKKPLSEVKVGDTFKIGEHEFIVLEQIGVDTVVLSKDLIGDEVKFGDTPDFAKSDVKKILDKFAEEIIKEIGDDALTTHAVDQTTLDGMFYYDASLAEMSLMTIEHVRKYADVLDKHKVDKWYWLVTPWSTPDRGWEHSMCVVAPSGDVGSISRYCSIIGVRPFCILKSDIFVS